MESKEGSVKKMIRLHLNAQRRSAFCMKNADGFHKKSIPLIKTTFKSPEIRINLATIKGMEKTVNISSQTNLHVPSIKSAKLDSLRCKSQKNILETTLKVKSST